MKGTAMIYKLKKIGLVTLAFICVFASIGTASAQSAVSGSVKNDTITPITISSPSCVGVLNPTPSGPTAVGQTYTFTATSSFSTSNGCVIRTTRTDNARYCNWALSRTKSTLSSPWSYPKIVKTSSPTGVTCNGTISNVNANGNWTATLTMDD